MYLLNLNFDLRFIKRRDYPLPLPTRLKIFQKKVNQYQPEIITFQEITDILPVFHLRRTLRRFGFVYYGLLKISGGVIVLYDKQKWNVLSKDFTEFSEQGKVFSKQLADRILRKGILVCVLQSRTSGKKILLLNVHLTANYGQKLKDEERKILKIQLEEIKKMIRKYKYHREIIAGDFNANFKSRRIQKWIQELDFIPVIQESICTVCPTKNPLCHRDQNKDYQIDNVLTRGFQKTSGRLVFNRKGEYLSDHYGQLVEIEF